MNNSTQSKWHDLADVYVHLHKDELGYPPKEWEQLKAEQIKEDIYRIKSIPFYARGIALDDEVCVATSPEGDSHVVDKVLRRSGFSTMRLWLKDREDKQALIDHFTKSGVLLEFHGPLVALAIPRKVFEQVSNYVCEEKDRGRWDAEDGYLVIDEPN